MMVYRKLICVFIVVMLSQCIGFSQARVSARLDSTHMMIGDRVMVHLLIEHPVSAVIDKVDLSGLEKDEHIEIYNSGKLDTLKSGNQFELQQDIAFTILDSGTFVVPPIIVKLIQNGRTTTMKSSDLVMEVSTPKNRSEALSPIKPIIKEPINLWDVLPWLIGILLILALIGGLVYYFKRKNLEKVPPPPIRKTPAFEIALQKLDGLKAKELWQKGEVKAYQSELTHVLREYLENRYAIQALESTTAQIQEQLKPLDFDQSMKGELTNMLQVADMVKFAKAKPPEDFHEQVMTQARSFVMKTKPAIIVDEYVDADGNAVPAPGSEQKGK